MGVYVYGVTWAKAGAPPGVTGIADEPVRAIAVDRLGALVSDFDAERVRAARRNLAVHSAVIAAAFARAQVLPLRFGSLFDDDETVGSDLLLAAYASLTSRLEELEGQVELGVKAFYREEAILTEVVRENRRVAKLREATVGRHAAATRGLRIELGQAVLEELDARRRADAAAIVARLQPLVQELSVDERDADTLVLKAALLARRDGLARIDRVMDELAREQDGRMQFTYVGPLAPHSFVDLRLEGAGAHGSR
jgi:hypothetical protein